MNAWPKINDIAADVQSGKMTAVENVKKSLSRIEEYKKFDAVISVIKDRSLERAEDIDKRIKNGGYGGKLAGVPFIAKDNYLAYGSDTTAASNILKGFQAPYQATVIERLESEGAICVAKANLDAFGHGGSTENSDFMVTKNPHDESRVPGGSSGGSAASVVLGLVPFALGTDTGGSSRQPASFSGCFGYKPTYGLMSRSGVIAMASSTDTVGTLAMRSEDIAAVVEVMSGHDELDSTTVERNKENYNLESISNIKNKKFGIIKEHMAEGIDEAVESSIISSIEKLRATGADVREVSLPSMPLSLAAYYIIIPAEISSNLSRYDGQRYGYFDPESKTLDESYELSRDKGFGKEPKRRIMIGSYVLSSGFYDAYYKKAALVRAKLIKEFDKAFESFDFLIGPTAPSVAFKIGEVSNDPLQMYLADVMTVGASLAGIPAISIPISREGDLPVGLQLMAPKNKDRDAIHAAKHIKEVI